MALDATVGGASADTYGTLVEAEAYFTARGDTAWTGDDADKEAALIKAAMYLDNVYRGRWKGQKATRDQALAWPRTWVIDVDGYSVPTAEIPAEIKNAQFQAALLFLSGTDLESAIERAVKSETIGELSVTYMDGAASQAQYPAITNWLGGLITGPVGVNGSFGSGAIVRS